jgi:small subunit ribosomal protein S18
MSEEIMDIKKETLEEPVEETPTTVTEEIVSNEDSFSQEESAQQEALQDNVIQEESPQSETVQENTVKDEPVQGDTVQEEAPQKEAVSSETLPNDVMKDEKLMAFDKEKMTRASKFKKKICRFCNDAKVVIDYKNKDLLEDFITDRGKILPRRVTGTCAKHQRDVAREVKRARIIAIIPFVEK